VIKVSQGCLGEEELAGVREVFASGYFGLGAKVFEFEGALKAYLGAEEVVATNTGTSALHLALDALGVGPGDEVILPSLTYVACFQAVRATGATPVPCDVDGDTLIADLSDMERRITARTKVLMPVDYAGNPCDIEALLSIKARHSVRIVEDAAHAFGSARNGRKVGSVGDIACFSFDSIKNISCGEGGAVVCRDAPLAERMRHKRSLGIERRAPVAAAEARGWQFQVRTQGFRYHMSGINGAIGLAQLGKVEGFIARRRAICRTYDEAFRDLPLIARLRIDYAECAPHIYVIRVREGRRDALMQHLKDGAIETGMNYIPNHLHEHFRGEGPALPETERAYREILTLPLHCGLSDADVGFVIERVRGFFGAGGGGRR
jgi:dTDP-4-amino-4,6-dideoxygalactose transaminase